MKNKEDNANKNNQLQQLHPAAQESVLQHFGDSAQVRIVKTFSQGNSGAAVCHAKISSDNNPEQDYVVRVINQGYALPEKYHPLVDSVVRSETYANKLLADEGIGADIFNYDPEHPPGALISECVTGRTLSNKDFDNQSLRQQFLSKLSRLHQLHFDDSQLHEWTLVQRTQFHIQQLLDQPEKLSDSLVEWLDNIQHKIKTIQTAADDVRLIHGDLRLNNIFLDENNQMKFIDLTDVSRGDPMEDIASLADSLGYNNEQALGLLHEYLFSKHNEKDFPQQWTKNSVAEAQISEDVLKRFQQAQALIQLRRGVWLLSTVLDKIDDKLTLPKSEPLTAIPKAERPGYESTDSKIKLAAACIEDFEDRMSNRNPPEPQEDLSSGII